MRRHCNISKVSDINNSFACYEMEAARGDCRQKSWISLFALYMRSHCQDSVCSQYSDLHHQVHISTWENLNYEPPNWVVLWHIDHALYNTIKYVDFRLRMTSAKCRPFGLGPSLITQVCILRKDMNVTSKINYIPLGQISFCRCIYKAYQRWTIVDCVFHVQSIYYIYSINMIQHVSKYFLIQFWKGYTKIKYSTNCIAKHCMHIS